MYGNIPAHGKINKSPTQRVCIFFASRIRCIGLSFFQAEEIFCNGSNSFYYLLQYGKLNVVGYFKSIPYGVHDVADLTGVPQKVELRNIKFQLAIKGILGFITNG